MEIFKRRPKFTYSFCAVCMQIIKENASDVNASYSTAAAKEVGICTFIYSRLAVRSIGAGSFSLRLSLSHTRFISLSLYRRLIVAFGKTPSYKLCRRATAG
jgi:hypothetical protein